MLFSNWLNMNATKCFIVCGHLHVNVKSDPWEVAFIVNIINRFLDTQTSQLLINWSCFLAFSLSANLNQHQTFSI